MKSLEFCEAAGLSNAELACWVNAGILAPDRIGAGARGQEFAAEQLPRVHVLKALHRKGITLVRLARVGLNLDDQAYVVYDDDDEGLRACPDAAAAIAAVVRARRWCCAVKL